MAELRPYPFSALLTRAIHELERGESIYDLPLRKLYTGDDELDLRVSHHGRVAGCALGPAAGPHTQMAQNLVLSWLAGCRIFELKTVQIMDELEIPRPCIDMETIGYNVEWSQELKLKQSLYEYVKGAMLIQILRERDELAGVEKFRDVIFDMSVGYDLAGIRSDAVLAFIDGMLDCSTIVDELRKEIPDELRQYRDLDFVTRLSDTLTLSTFHGCPPDEIEKIIEFLLDEKQLHCTVKLNPTLLGPDRLREIMHDELGYTEAITPQKAFDDDTKWEQAQGFLDRLGSKAEGLGLSFGAKFTNTLIVENHRSFFPEAEEQMYLSGPPLHVLAIHLVAQTRETFADRFPISFSAGIDSKNFDDAVAIGLVPITVCSDLLKPGGYGRTAPYFSKLEKRMRSVGARDIPELIIRGFGNGEAALGDLGLDAEQRGRCVAALDGGDLRAAAGRSFDAWVSAATVRNTQSYLEQVRSDDRYSYAKNSKPPRKLGSHLELFDCVSCHKCVPVCPNDANFMIEIPVVDQAIAVLSKNDAGWSVEQKKMLSVQKKAQYANFADFCNECGNCDIFCPEDGGPYVVKPRFFGTFSDFEELAHLDGFFVSGQTVLGRFDGKAYRLRLDGDRATYAGDDFSVEFEPDDIPATVSGDAQSDVDLTYYYIMRWLREAALSSASSYIRYLGSGQ